MTTTQQPSPGNADVGDHVLMSRNFLEQAKIELSKGDGLQASEKVWGAVAHALKAIGVQRGWRHRSTRASRTSPPTWETNLTGETFSAI